MIRSSDDSLLQGSLTNFERTASILEGEVEKGLLEKICRPKERIELTYGLQLDDGQVHVVQGFIERYSFGGG